MADIIGCGERQMIFFYFTFSWALIRNLFWASLIFEAITINHFSAKKTPPKNAVYMKLDLGMI